MGEDGKAVKNILEHPLEEGFIIIDFGQNTNEAINDSLQISKKLLWVDDLSLK